MCSKPLRLRRPRTSEMHLPSLAIHRAHGARHPPGRMLRGRPFSPSGHPRRATLGPRPVYHGSAAYLPRADGRRGPCYHSLVARRPPSGSPSGRVLDSPCSLESGRRSWATKKTFWQPTRGASSLLAGCHSRKPCPQVDPHGTTAPRVGTSSVSSRRSAAAFRSRRRSVIIWECCYAKRPHGKNTRGGPGNP